MKNMTDFCNTMKPVWIRARKRMCVFFFTQKILRIPQKLISKG